MLGKKIFERTIMRKTSKLHLLLKLAVAAALFTSCATVHSAFLTNVSAPSSRGKMIESSAEKFVFLAFNFDNDYVFEAQRKLASSCPNGMVTGILTTFETKWYFLFTNYEVRARGLCVQSKHAANDWGSPSDRVAIDKGSSQ